MKIKRVLLTTLVIFFLLAGTAMAADDDKDKDVKIVKSNNDTKISNTDSVKITPDLKTGQGIFNQFAFADDSYSLLSLLYYIFYFGCGAGILYVGILALYDIIKGTKDLKRIAHDISHMKSVQAIVVLIFIVKIAYMLVDFGFNWG